MACCLLHEQGSSKEGTPQVQIRPDNTDHAKVEDHMNTSNRLREKRKKKKNCKKTEWKNKALEIYSKLQDGKEPAQPTHQSPCSKFEDCK